MILASPPLELWKCQPRVSSPHAAESLGYEERALTNWAKEALPSCTLGGGFRESMQKKPNCGHKTRTLQLTPPYASHRLPNFWLCFLCVFQLLVCKPIRYLCSIVRDTVSLWHRLQIFWTFLIQSSSIQVASRAGFLPDGLREASWKMCHSRWNFGRRRQHFGSLWHWVTNCRTKAPPTTETWFCSSADSQGVPETRTRMAEFASQTIARRSLKAAGRSGLAVSSSSQRRIT